MRPICSFSWYACISSFALKQQLIYKSLASKIKWRLKHTIIDKPSDHNILTSIFALWILQAECTPNCESYIRAKDGSTLVYTICCEVSVIYETFNPLLVSVKKKEYIHVHTKNSPDVSTETDEIISIFYHLINHRNNCLWSIIETIVYEYYRVAPQF